MSKKRHFTPRTHIAGVRLELGRNIEQLWSEAGEHDPISGADLVDMVSEFFDRRGTWREIDESFMCEGLRFVRVEELGGYFAYDPEDDAILTFTIRGDEQPESRSLLDAVQVDEHRGIEEGEEFYKTIRRAGVFIPPNAAELAASLPAPEIVRPVPSDAANTNPVRYTDTDYLKMMQELAVKAGAPGEPDADNYWRGHFECSNRQLIEELERDAEVDQEREDAAYWRGVAEAADVAHAAVLRLYFARARGVGHFTEESASELVPDAIMDRWGMTLEDIKLNGGCTAVEGK